MPILAASRSGRGAINHSVTRHIESAHERSAAYGNLCKLKKPGDHQLRCDKKRAVGSHRGDRRRSCRRTTHAWSHIAGGGARRRSGARSAQRRAARQRNRAPADARSAHHAARRPARAPASYGLEERLRPRPVRRLHGADGRQAREIVPLARCPRGGARDHDHRRPGARRAAPSRCKPPSSSATPSSAAIARPGRSWPASPASPRATPARRRKSATG